MVAEIKTRTVDGRVDDCQAFNSLLTQFRVELRLRCDMTPAERAVKPPEQTVQHRLLTAEVVERDLAFLSDCVEHNVRRAVARLKRAQVNTRGHFQPPTRLVEKRQNHKRL